jgi:hypothetical protein
MNTLVILAGLMLSPASAGCTDGTCAVEDVTSLIQAKATITPGDARLPDPDEMAAADEKLQELMAINDLAEEVDVEADQLALRDAGLVRGEHEDDPPTTTTTTMNTTGCVDKGCYGSGPFCGGNALDCTSRGYIVTGYYKTCGSETCTKGYKVRCAWCPPGIAVSLPFPLPDPAVTMWQEPTTTTTSTTTVAPPPGPAPTTVAPAWGWGPTIPPNAPVFPPTPYDANATKNAIAALKAAEANLKALEATVAINKQAEAACSANISLFQNKRKAADKEFKKARNAAVSYSKKVQMLNITIFEEQDNMHNAFYAQKGAEEGAQLELANAKNSQAQKNYYEKQVVDSKHAVSKAMNQVNLGRTAVKKANYDAALSQKKDRRAQKQAKADIKFDQKWNDVGVTSAEKSSVKGAMEDAFVSASTPARKLTNTPPYGGKNPN